MAAPNHNALLDKLQANVNLVLEQTGRVFAALDQKSKKPPTAQINKLKQIIPKAQNEFHEALDQFEEELQLAQLVMRRDLALFREREGLHVQSTPEPQTIEAPATEVPSAPLPEGDQTVSPADSEHIQATTAPAEDVAMEDSLPEERPNVAERAAADVEMTEQAPEPQLEATGVEPAPAQLDTPDAEATSAPEAQIQQELQTEVQSLSKAESSPPNAKKPVTNLQLDIAPDAAKVDKDTENEKAPDTAKESANNDLDSLFGGGDTSNDANNEFTFGENATGDIDFGDFTTFNTDSGDNDNISSLLPGLEDYANTQPNNTSGAELDLNSFFNTESSNQNNNVSQSTQNPDGGIQRTNSPSTQANQQPTDRQHDTTFDDLMDLNFDDQGMDDANNTADLDFDSLFN